MAKSNIKRVHEAIEPVSSAIIPVLDIYLDSENPRHEPINDEAEIVNFLLKNDKVKELAKNISQNGLSPIENIAVIQDNQKRYIVIEGNRRICALKLLNDIDRVPTKYKQFFSDCIKKPNKIPTEINCVIIAGREAFDIWLATKHEGEANGVGVRQWSAEQKTRFSKSRDKKDNNALAHTLLEYAKKSGFIDPTSKEKYLTTITRYMSGKGFRETFGITSLPTESDVMINVSYAEFDRVFQYFCNNLNDKTVNSRANRSAQEDYLGALRIKKIIPQHYHSESKRLADKPEIPDMDSVAPTADEGDDLVDIVQPPSIITPIGGTGSPGVTPTTRGPNHPNTRRYAISNKSNIIIHDPILRRILEEIKSIPVDDYPLAAVCVTRVFLENIYKLFHEKVYGHYPSDNTQTHVIIQKIIQYIEKDDAVVLSRQERNALTALKQIANNTAKLLSPKSLGANAHGAIYPNSTEIKTEWDNIEKIVEYMTNKLKNEQ